jgi:hypothetical protein
LRNFYLINSIRILAVIWSLKLIKYSLFNKLIRLMKLDIKLLKI